MENTIHQIWVGPHKMPSREQRLVSEVAVRHAGDHRMWTSDNLPLMPGPVRTVYDVFGRNRDYAHQADVLRVFLIYEYGGTYLDVDMEWKGGLDLERLRSRSGFFCYHNPTDFTIPNTAFGAARGNRIMKYLLDAISPNCWWYGPSWMGDTVKAYFNLGREVPQELVAFNLMMEGMDYERWHTFETTRFLHLSLYSWSPENRDRFEKGLMT